LLLSLFINLLLLLLLYIYIYILILFLLLEKEYIYFLIIFIKKKNTWIFYFFLTLILKKKKNYVNLIWVSWKKCPLTPFPPPPHSLHVDKNYMFIYKYIILRICSSEFFYLYLIISTSLTLLISLTAISFNGIYKIIDPRVIKK